MRLRYPALAILLAALVLGCAHRPPSAAPALAQPSGAAPAPAGASPAAPLPGGATPTAAPTAVADPYAALERARASLASLRVVRGRFESGTDSVSWAAYYDRDSLRLITESIRTAVYGQRSNEYLFAGGVLRVFSSSGDHAMTGPGDQRGPYRARIAYDSAGTVVASEKFVSEQKGTFESFESSAAQGRADWLRAHVITLPPANH